MSMMDVVGVGEYRLPDSIDESRLDLVAEFMAKPRGRHSNDLQLLLSRMRSDRTIGRMLLVRSEDGQGYWMAWSPAKRGDNYRRISLYASREEAERFAFAIRWELHTSRVLPGFAGAMPLS